MGQKYNANYHSSVVSNMKQLWAENKKDTVLLLTPEEIWEVFNEAYFLMELDSDPDDIYLEYLTQENEAKAGG